MLKEERYEKILEIIEEENYTSSIDLACRLYVSLPTIRRDLSELQRRNLILRSHGGAKKVNTEQIVMPLDYRNTLYPAAKRKLCREAAKQIEDNMMIFIDASTTAAQMADFLSAKKSVKVVTNSIPLSVALTKKGVQTYCTGGEMQESSLCYTGAYAEDFIQNFHFDILFFSAFGVNKKGWICDVSMPEIMFRKAALSCAEKLVFLCDETKLYRPAPYNLMPVSRVDLVITDAPNAPALLSDVAKEKICVAE